MLKPGNLDTRANSIDAVHENVKPGHVLFFNFVLRTSHHSRQLHLEKSVCEWTWSHRRNLCKSTRGHLGLQEGCEGVTSNVTKSAELFSTVTSGLGRDFHRGDLCTLLCKTRPFKPGSFVSTNSPRFCHVPIRRPLIQRLVAKLAVQMVATFEDSFLR